MKDLRGKIRKEDPSKYTVWVDDNFHMFDQSESYFQGHFDTLEEAIAEAKSIIDAAVFSSEDPEGSFDSYTMLGPDPSVIRPRDSNFYAWAYAKQSIYEKSIQEYGWNKKNFGLRQAIKLAKKYHKGQLDKGGKPYINHPLAVMAILQDDKSKIAGVLHDIIEDTPITPNDLLKMGCPADIVCAIELVTKDKIYSGDMYLYFIENINLNQTNQIASDVKWADLTVNSDISRIPNPTTEDYARIERYKKAKEILKPFVSSYLTGDNQTQMNF